MSDLRMPSNSNGAYPRTAAQPPSAPLVMIVDDDPAICAAVRRLLIAAGHAVRVFVNSDELAAAGRPAGVSCLLLDLNLPGVGGQEVLMAVRANPAWQHVPVVIFTTSDEPRDRAACAAAGADEYVLKPGGFGELIDLFNSLGQRWLTAEHRTVPEA